MIRSLFMRARRWITATFGSTESAPERAIPKCKPKLEVLESREMPAWTVNTLATLTPLALVKNLVGPGVQVKNVTYTGSNTAAGIFTDTATSTGIKNGVVLSSGSASGVRGPNNSTGFGPSNGTPGDTDLDAIIAPDVGFDASVLEFDFVPKGSVLSLQYVFGSEEYNEFAPPNFGINDVFGFFLNGKNIALLPGTSTPVSIATVNTITNTKYYVDNDFQPVSPRDTQMDGFTKVLPITLSVVPNKVNHIKLAIQDASDTILDSWVLIKAGSIGSAVIRTYSPIRFVRNPVTRLYSGTILVSNISTVSLGGPLYLMFPKLPKGVTLANPTGKSKTGVPFIALPGNNGLAAKKTIAIKVTFTNPYNQNLGTFFSSNLVQITGIIQ